MSDLVVTLSTFNYKVEAFTGQSSATLKPISTVFDTGAGPNLIRVDLLPREVLATIDRERPVANLASESNHRLVTLGIV